MTVVLFGFFNPKRKVSFKDNVNKIFCNLLINLVRILIFFQDIVEWAIGMLDCVIVTCLYHRDFSTPT